MQFRDELKPEIDNTIQDPIKAAPRHDRPLNPKSSPSTIWELIVRNSSSR